MQRSWAQGSVGCGVLRWLSIICPDVHQKRHMPSPRYATVVLVHVSTLPVCPREGLLCSVVPTGIRNCRRLESAPPHFGGLILRLLNALIRSAAAPRQHLQQVASKSLVLAHACRVGRSDVNFLCNHSGCSLSSRCLKRGEQGELELHLHLNLGLLCKVQAVLHLSAASHTSIILSIHVHVCFFTRHAFWRSKQFVYCLTPG